MREKQYLEVRSSNWQTAKPLSTRWKMSLQNKTRYRQQFCIIESEIDCQGLAVTIQSQFCSNVSSGYKVNDLKDSSCDYGIFWPRHQQDGC